MENEKTVACTSNPMEHLKAKLCEYKAELDEQHRELSELCKPYIICPNVQKETSRFAPEGESFKGVANLCGSLDNSTSGDLGLLKEEENCEEKSISESEQVTAINKKSYNSQHERANWPQLDLFNSPDKQTKRGICGNTEEALSNICCVRSLSENKSCCPTPFYGNPCIKYYFPHNRKYYNSQVDEVLPCTKSEFNRSCCSQAIVEGSNSIFTNEVCQCNGLKADAADDNVTHCECSKLSQCDGSFNGNCAEITDTNSSPVLHWNTSVKGISPPNRVVTSCTCKCFHNLHKPLDTPAVIMDTTEDLNGQNRESIYGYGPLSGSLLPWQSSDPTPDENGIIWPMPEDLGLAGLGFNPGINETFASRSDVDFSGENWVCFRVE